MAYQDLERLLLVLPFEEKKRLLNKETFLLAQLLALLRQLVQQLSVDFLQEAQQFVFFIFDVKAKLVARITFANKLLVLIIIIFENSIKEFEQIMLGIVWHTLYLLDAF